MTTPPVFLVPALPDGADAVLDGQEGHHAATVRRMRVGESLVLGDGAGGTARCEVTEVGKQSLRLRVLDRITVPAPPLRVTVVQALVKGDGELAVELATEAGADEIVPWRAARCVAKWEDGPRGAKALARWRGAAAAAAKQARRAWVPPVAEPVDLNGLVDQVRSAEQTLVLHESADTALTDVTLPTSGRLLLVVGPEGGIADHELDTLRNAGGAVVRIGDTVLRARTVAAVALGAVGILTTRWQ